MVGVFYMSLDNLNKSGALGCEFTLCLFFERIRSLLFNEVLETTTIPSNSDYLAFEQFKFLPENFFVDLCSLAPL